MHVGIAWEISSTSDASLPLSISVNCLKFNGEIRHYSWNGRSYFIAVYLWARLCHFDANTASTNLYKSSQFWYMKIFRNAIRCAHRMFEVALRCGSFDWFGRYCLCIVAAAFAVAFGECGSATHKNAHFFRSLSVLRTLNTLNTQVSDVRENNMRCTCVPLAPIDREEELTKTERSINLIKYNVCWRTVPSFRCYVLWFCFRLPFSAFIYIFFRSYRMSGPLIPEPACAICFANIFPFFSQCLRYSSFSLYSFVEDIYVFCLENICIYQKQTEFEEYLASCFNLANR